jgi:hypothetical protein
MMQPSSIPGSALSKEFAAVPTIVVSDVEHVMAHE